MSSNSFTLPPAQERPRTQRQSPSNGGVHRSLPSSLDTRVQFIFAFLFLVITPEFWIGSPCLLATCSSFFCIPCPDETAPGPTVICDYSTFGPPANLSAPRTQFVTPSFSVQPLSHPLEIHGPFHTPHPIRDSLFLSPARLSHPLEIHGLCFSLVISL